MADDDALATFTALIGADSPEAVDQAKQILAVCDGNVEAAVDLHFSGAFSAPAPQPFTNRLDAPGAVLGDPYADMGRFSHLGSTSFRMGTPAQAQEDDASSMQPSYQAQFGVRAPDPVTRDILYNPAGRHSGRYRPPPEPEVHAFRDFQAEASTSEPSSTGLAQMFAPPREIMTEGSWDLVTHQATNQKRWLIVNLQSNEEFASHQLNRDTWSNKALRELISASFLFWQTQVSATSEDARKVMSFYRLHGKTLPVILLLDPQTLGQERMWQGFTEPERLLEALEPYASGSTRSTPAPHRRSASSAAPKAKRLTEEEELMLALEASKAESGQRSSTPEPAPAPTAAEPEVPAASSSPEKPLQPEAQPQASLPEEPPPNTADAITIRMRLTTGATLTRSFYPSCTVAQVQSVCSAEVPEGCTRPFSLLDPASRSVLAPEQTLGNCFEGQKRVALSMRWAET